MDLQIEGGRGRKCKTSNLYKVSNFDLSGRIQKNAVKKCPVTALRHFDAFVKQENGIAESRFYDMHKNIMCYSEYKMQIAH